MSNQSEEPQCVEIQKCKDCEDDDELPKPEGFKDEAAILNDGSSELVPIRLDENNNEKAIKEEYYELPRDMLKIISQKLGCKFYLLRFRSVCSNWRSLTQSHRDLILPNHHPDLNEVSFSKSQFYLLTPHGEHQFPPWLVKVGKDHTGKVHFWHPLLNDHSLASFPLPEPILDFDQMSALHLAHELRVNYRGRLVNPLDHLGLHSYSEKTAAAMWQEQPQFVHVVSPGFRIPTGVSHVFHGIDQWDKVFHGHSGDLKDSMCIADICVYNCRPYVIEVSGRTFKLAPDYTGEVLEVADAIPLHKGCDAKLHLVVRGSDLLLVQKFLHYNNRSVLWVTVYKLNEGEKRWIPLEELGDTVLFVGEHSSFSVSASQFSSAARPVTCIIFQAESESAPNYGIQVCEYPNLMISQLSEYEEYASLFWPPPEWAMLR